MPKTPNSRFSATLDLANIFLAHILLDPNYSCLASSFNHEVYKAKKFRGPGTQEKLNDTFKTMKIRP